MGSNWGDDTPWLANADPPVQPEPDWRWIDVIIFASCFVFLVVVGLATAR